MFTIRVSMSRRNGVVMFTARVSMFGPTYCKYLPCNARVIPNPSSLTLTLSLQPVRTLLYGMSAFDVKLDLLSTTEMYATSLYDLLQLREYSLKPARALSLQPARALSET